jgi:hypothetical protein
LLLINPPVYQHLTFLVLINLRRLSRGITPTAARRECSPTSAQASPSAIDPLARKSHRNQQRDQGQYIAAIVKANDGDYADLVALHREFGELRCDDNDVSQ